MVDKEDMERVIKHIGEIGRNYQCCVTGGCL